MATEEEINDEEIIISEDARLLENDDLEYFYSGNTLNVEEAYEIMKSNNTKIIIIAGHIGSGKTTILSAIYEKYQMGDNNLYSFSGSKTLIGFEKCAHHSRLVSNGKKPNTQRTRFEDEYKFLHLELIRNNDQNKMNILISDVSGEKFDRIKTSSEECDNNRIITRADYFVYVFDGEKMIDMISRDVYISNFLTTIRRLVENDVLLESTKIQILISKSDIIKTANDRIIKEVEAVIDSLVKTKLPKAFKDKKFCFTNSWICAQNKLNTDLDNSEIIDIEIILDEWLNYNPKSRFDLETYYEINNLRMIDKYSLSSEDFKDE